LVSKTVSYVSSSKASHAGNCIKMLISFVVLTAVISPLLGQSVDKTLVARETGKEVVDAVVDRIILTCIFDNDKLMLKRMAQAESNDGSKLSTTGDFNGGIWRVGG